MDEDTQDTRKWGGWFIGGVTGGALLLVVLWVFNPFGWGTAPTPCNTCLSHTPTPAVSTPSPTRSHPTSTPVSPTEVPTFPPPLPTAPPTEVPTAVPTLPLPLPTAGVLSPKMGIAFATNGGIIGSGGSTTHESSKACSSRPGPMDGLQRISARPARQPTPVCQGRHRLALPQLGGPHSNPCRPLA